MVGVDLDKLKHNKKEDDRKQYAQAKMYVKPLFDKEAEKRHAVVSFSARQAL